MGNKSHKQEKSSLGMRAYWHAHHTLVICCAFIVLIAATLGVGIFHHTVTLGETLAFKRSSDGSLRQVITDYTQQYKIGINSPEGINYFTLEEMGFSVDVDATVQHIQKTRRNPLRTATWWLPLNTQVVLRTENTKLQSFITKNLRIITTPASDATINISRGKVRVTGGQAGVQYTIENPSRELLKAASRLQLAPITLKPMTANPIASTETLEPARKHVQSILGQSVTIKIGDQIVRPTSRQIGNWLSLHQNGVAVLVNADAKKIQEFLQNIANSHNRTSRDQIQDGTNILIRGERSIRVGNVRESARKLARDIPNGQGTHSVLPVTTTAFKTIYAPTSGKWIEVDIVTKRMYAYNQGKIVRTFLVSAGAPATPTPIGRFAIYAKYGSQNMTGYNTDGTRYFQPTVPYVNYFFGDYAIHGNYWRPTSWFGSINSSHGCVGLLVNDSAWIYNWAPIGTPVISHT